MDLRALRDKSATVTMEWLGERLMFNYNPYAYNDKHQEIINMLGQPEDKGGTKNQDICNIFADVMTSWDMKDGGVEVPCTMESFLELSPFLRTKILNAIVEDELETGKSKDSANISNRGARSGALVPIGSTNTQPSNGQVSETPVTS